MVCRDCYDIIIIIIIITYLHLGSINLLWRELTEKFFLSLFDSGDAD